MLIDLVKALVFGCLAALSFGLVYELKPRLLVIAALGGGLGWLTYYVFSGPLAIAEVAAYFIATVLVSCYAELMARLIRQPAIIFQIVGVMPMVPGQTIYDTMRALARGDSHLGLVLGLNALNIAGAMALGILLSSTIFRAVRMNSLAKFIKKSD